MFNSIITLESVDDLIDQPKEVDNTAYYRIKITLMLLLTYQNNKQIKH